MATIRRTRALLFGASAPTRLGAVLPAFALLPAFTVLSAFAVLAAVALLVTGCQLDAASTTDTGPPASSGSNRPQDPVTPAGPTGSGTTVAPSPASTPASTRAPTTTAAPTLPTAFDAIATRTMMTPEARALLAQSNPELVERTSLGSACPLEPDVSVLGCYRSGHIAVLHLTDPRLDGLTEAIAAHEMLHAAWASLSDAERQRLGTLLEAAYQKSATTELNGRIEAYRNRDPSSVDNELDSILGTEVSTVGPELETWYQRWFTNRKAVVKLAAGAQSTLASLRKQVDDLDSRLRKLRTQIDTEETTLETQRADLAVQSTNLEALKAAGRMADFNAGVDPFNQQVDAYNTAVGAHKALVDKHNTMVQKRNGLAAAYTDLAAQITTTAQSIRSG